MQANNESKSVCAKICEDNGWKKEGRRNVVTINNEKWSFSVSVSKPQCRQVYEDTVGFITLFGNSSLLKYYVKSFDEFTVSRVSPNGVKAYNIVIDDVSKMQKVF